jgi:hypothetical protein
VLKLAKSADAEASDEYAVRATAATSQVPEDSAGAVGHAVTEALLLPDGLELAITVADGVTSLDTLAVCVNVRVPVLVMVPLIVGWLVPVRVPLAVRLAAAGTLTDTEAEGETERVPIFSVGELVPVTVADNIVIVARGYDCDGLSDAVWAPPVVGAVE